MYKEISEYFNIFVINRKSRTVYGHADLSVFVNIIRICFVYSSGTSAGVFVCVAGMYRHSMHCLSTTQA